MDCGEPYPYWILEFDHTGDDKLFTISDTRLRNRGGVSLEDIVKEIEKCDLVCSNCHKNRTHYRKVRSGADVLDIAEDYN